MQRRCMWIAESQTAWWDASSNMLIVSLWALQVSGPKDISFKHGWGNHTSMSGWGCWRVLHVTTNRSIRGGSRQRRTNSHPFLETVARDSCNTSRHLGNVCKTPIACCNQTTGSDENKILKQNWDVAQAARREAHVFGASVGMWLCESSADMDSHTVNEASDRPLHSSSDLLTFCFVVYAGHIIWYLAISLFLPTYQEKHSTSCDEKAMSVPEPTIPQRCSHCIG